MSRLRELMAERASAVEEELARLLPVDDLPERRLWEAMRYACLNGGKRLRPFLVTATADMFRVSSAASLRVAAAVEMLHCYSLVHDDLPAMDDDDLRRGRPTVHRRFDEATAILAGDGLLTRAFEVLADVGAHPDPAVRTELVMELARAAGAGGMVGGQMVDLLAERQDGFGPAMDVAAVTRMHQLKTGGLIGFSCCAGAILGKASLPLRQALSKYAHDLGLAFQIVDDLLDVEGDTAELGKTAGKDAAAGKQTFVTLLGVERARTHADMLVQQAVTHLKPFDGEADLLREVAQFVLTRRA
ncbi:polyprenyl synthetase family protein [Caenispirillum bisanense]|uniref:polyprenyl synthetase family protein n=1 Tax=Caenispirillum bisanense TaxID=414052 RepID=UPI0031D16F9A